MTSGVVVRHLLPFLLAQCVIDQVMAAISVVFTKWNMANVQGWLLFEGGYYLRVATI